MLDVPNLDYKLASLSERLKQRETELTILDQVLLGVYTQRCNPAAHHQRMDVFSFGERVDPISGKKAWHEGMDFAGANGSDVIA